MREDDLHDLWVVLANGVDHMLHVFGGMDVLRARRALDIYKRFVSAGIQAQPYPSRMGLHGYIWQTPCSGQFLDLSDKMAEYIKSVEQ